VDVADTEMARSVEPLRHHLRGPAARAGPDLILQTSFQPTLTQKNLQGQNFDITRYV
jgi:hypothetical protein